MSGVDESWLAFARYLSDAYSDGVDPDLRYGSKGYLLVHGLSGLSIPSVSARDDIRLETLEYVLNIIQTEIAKSRKKEV
jgi:hypothetical protein